MEVLFIAVAIGTIVAGILFWVKGSGGHKETNSQSQVPNTTLNRQFTLQELRAVYQGKYKWDKTGTVFEVNDDGTITIVGQLKPEELVAAQLEEEARGKHHQEEPVQNDVKSKGILDMLPRMWCFLEQKDEAEKEWKLYVEFNQTSGLWRLPDVEAMDVAGFFDKIGPVNGVESHQTGDFPQGFQAMMNSGAGRVVLLPQNEWEYMLSLGAKAYLERMHQEWGWNFQVMISTPAVMGALGTCCKIAKQSIAKVSFAYGCEEDYACCDMEMEDGVFEVKGLSPSSIIQPSSETVAANLIKKGLIATLFTRGGRIKDCLLLDVNPYALLLMVGKVGEGASFVPLSSPCSTIPFATQYTEVQIQPDQNLWLFLGGTICTGNLLDYEIDASSPIQIKVDCDVNQQIEIHVKTMTGNEACIDVGELICNQYIE